MGGRGRRPAEQAEQGDQADHQGHDEHASLQDEMGADEEVVAAAVGVPRVVPVRPVQRGEAADQSRNSQAARQRNDRRPGVEIRLWRVITPLLFPDG